MTINPIIPLPIMIIICIVLILLKRKGIWNFIRQIIIVLLLFMINLRIVVPTDTVLVVKNDVDVLFVVDDTISMVAEDYNGSERRIDAVKEDVNTIMEQFPGARFGLVTFSNTAQYLVPYTSEISLIDQAVSNLNGPSKRSAEGTSLNIVYDTMLDALKRSGEYDEEGRIRILFFISDGENTKNQKLKSFSKMAEYVDAGYVLGYGTKDGGYMKVKSAYEDGYEILTYTDNGYNTVKAVSKIDEKNLKTIADDLEIEYKHMTKHSDIVKITDNIHSGIETGEIVLEETKQSGFTEIYWMFAIALAAFMFIDFLYYRYKLGKEV